MKKVLLVLISIFLLSGVFALNIQFDSFKVYSGSDPLVGEVSCYSMIELFLNGNDKGYVVSDGRESNLDWASRDNLNVRVGDIIHLLNDAGEELNFTLGNEDFILGNGGRKDIDFDEVGSYTLRDSNLNSITIAVNREMVDFSFENLVYTDGRNEVKFKVTNLSDSSYEYFNYNITVNKYPVTITLTDYTSVINSQTNFFNFTGAVTESGQRIVYLLNQDFSTVSTVASFISVVMNNNEFEGQIDVSDLRAGENMITFVSFDEDVSLQYAYAKGMKKINFTVDRTAPYLEISDPRFSLFARDANLIFNVSTDGVRIIYELNGNNNTVDVYNGTATLSLNLVQGTNNLTLTVYDAAGNDYKEAHAIGFDDRRPEILELYPEELFSTGDRTSHQQIVSVSGKISKPNVEVVMFSLPEDAPSCNDYQSSFFRQDDDGQGDVYGGMDYNSSQISVNLGLIYQKQEFETDSNGEFGSSTFLTNPKNLVLLGLQSGNIFDDRVDDHTINKVDTSNKVCFILKDGYGNVETYSYNVRLDLGNTMWRASAPKTYPNTVYAAEIEQANAQEYSSNTEFGLIVNMVYTGSGEVTGISGVSIDTDSSYEDNRYVDIDNGRMTYYLDKESGELVVYVPVKLLPRNIKAIDYPSEMSFRFMAEFTYTLDDIDIPVDNINPVYFTTTLNVERPFDHTKFLSPEQIDKFIGYLNTTIELTEHLVEYTKWGSVVGIVACQVKQFWLGVKSKDEAPNEEDYKSLYKWCDRVFCLPSPEECSMKDDADGVVNFKGKVAELTDENRYLKDVDGKITGSIDSAIKTGKNCKTEAGKNGVEVFMKIKDVKNYGKATILNSYITSEKITSDKVACIPLDEEGNLDSFNIGKYTGICYNENEPSYDGSKCWWPGMSKGFSDKDSRDNLLESIMCGCLPDTYSHLSQWLAIQKSMQGCLEQAKLGEMEGSYCERLLSQAVCDVATSIILPSVKAYVSREQVQNGEATNFGKYFGEISDNVNDRYGDNALAKRALDTSQLSNKMCVAAISGDWSVLAEDLLASLDENQIEPMIGPMFPVSRIVGYNPIDGSLAIEYRFTHGLISGGQDIKTEFYLTCDKTKTGSEYCPQKLERIPLGTRYVTEGGSTQETIVELDEDSFYWYNVIVAEHTYDLDGDDKRQVQQETILHKGEIPLECSFSLGVMGSGAGFNCDTIMGDNPLISGWTINDATMMPQQVKGTSNTAVYYPGSDVYALIDYRILGAMRNGDTFGGGNNEYKVGYEITCTGQTSTSTNIQMRTLQIPPGEGEGEVLVKILGGEDVRFGISSSGTYEYKTQDVGSDTKENSYFICVNNNNNENTISVNMNTFTGQKDMVKPISMNVNKNAVNCDNTILVVNKKTPISFRTNDEVANVEYILVSYKTDVKNTDLNKVDMYKASQNKIHFTKSTNPIVIDDPTQVNNLQPGKCEIKLAPFNANRDTNDVNSFSDAMNTDNFQTNVDISDWTGTIEFKTPPSDGNEKFTWDVAIPQKGSSYCFNQNGFKIMIPALSSGGSEKLKSGRLKYKLYYKDVEQNGAEICIAGCVAEKGIDLIYGNANDNTEIDKMYFFNINGVPGEQPEPLNSIGNIFAHLKETLSGKVSSTTIAYTSAEFKLVVQGYKEDLNTVEGGSYSTDFVLTDCGGTGDGQPSNNQR